MANSSIAEIEIFLKKQTFQIWQIFKSFLKYPLQHVFIMCDTIFFIVHDEIEFDKKITKSQMPVDLPALQGGGGGGNK
jgi:hypothetical protein